MILRSNFLRNNKAPKAPALRTAAQLRGFTLIELLVVIAIIGVLLAFNEGRDDYAEWHPDGNRLVIVSEREGKHDLYLVWIQK